MEKKLSTESYKGTRDFYPADMAVQRYIFDTWAKTAESYGFERYDASILEPSELYKSKGVENEELVNEQTYTFIDRGDREVTLRPEMTPTVARMVAGKRRDLHFPVRWYSIPNLFRYERPQRGRLREHWQLNCDMFGIDHYSADVEMIALAYHTLIAFGATPDMFQIHINDRRDMKEFYASFDITDEHIISEMTRLNDRKNKITPDEYLNQLASITGGVEKATILAEALTAPVPSNVLVNALRALGISNSTVNRTISRGFDYYTGTIFEVFDTSPENNRSLLGGGRYDNLTSLFGGDPISGMGFGMGDVTMRDFLETHNLLKENVPNTAPTLVIIPLNDTLNIEGEKIAQEFRNAGIRVSVDISGRKSDRKKVSAEKMGAPYILLLDDTSHTTKQYTLKQLTTHETKTDFIPELIKYIA